ncbi:hypothetical protein V6M85_07690 [Sulfolobus tengchongensis]|uniref:Uncharacterized protein n=1 Tax=Sulfolobus tengchongensis TaxID=207809 RepID=A0AAX4L3R5_9CREN
MGLNELREEIISFNINLARLEGKRNYSTDMFTKLFLEGAKELTSSPS